MTTKLVEMYGVLVEVKMCRPSRRKAGLGMTKAKFQKITTRQAERYMAREAEQFIR